MPTGLRETVPLTLYLGKPQRHGDIASVVIVGTLLGQSEHAVGRLFKPAGGGLELLFGSLPAFPIPSGITVTLDNLALKVTGERTATKNVKQHGHQRKVKVHYSLITNPTACSSGHWAGTLVVGFSSGAPVTQALTIPCSA